MLKQKISEEEINFIIGNTVASLSFEGLISTEEEIETMRKVLRGETTADKEAKKYLAQALRQGQRT